MTFSFRVVLVITHKMVYKKAYTTCVWGHNSSILAYVQLLPRKGRSLIVVVWCVDRLILFKLCVREKQKKEEEEEERCKMRSYKDDAILFLSGA